MEELLKEKHEEVAAIIVEPLMQGAWRNDYNAKRIFKRTARFMYKVQCIIYYR